MCAETLFSKLAETKSQAARKAEFEETNLLAAPPKVNAKAANRRPNETGGSRAWCLAVFCANGSPERHGCGRHR